MFSNFPLEVLTIRDLRVRNFRHENSTIFERHSFHQHRLNYRYHDTCVIANQVIIIINYILRQLQQIDTTGQHDGTTNMSIFQL